MSHPYPRGAGGRERVAPLGSRGAPELQQLYDSCADYMVRVTGAPPDPDAALQLLNALPPGCSAERKLLLGTRDRDGVLLGAADIILDFPRPRTWYIGEFIIAPPARSRGVGRALFTEVCVRAQAAGADRIDLVVHQSNDAALAFWGRFGFQASGETTYRIRGRERPFVRMSANL